uniref:Transposase n=2 Tax=Heterorhabditis bacteriophora TaxID=37862 RepID=A0A1I7W8R7_HETBA
MVSRILKANAFTTRERMRKSPSLTADHKKARMDFAVHTYHGLRNGQRRQRCHPRELQYKGLVSTLENSPYGLAVSFTGPKSHENFFGEY